MAALAECFGVVQVKVEGTTCRECAGVLATASPVFERMLLSGMKEATCQTIELHKKKRSEFDAFMGFLRPGTSRAAKIDVNNVDFLLRWFDEYQVPALKDECEAFLLGLPPSIQRLLQAKQFLLKRQYKRCLEAVAMDFHTMPVEQVLEWDLEVMKELLPLMKNNMNNLRSAVLRLPQRASDASPPTMPPNTTVKDLVKEIVADTVKGMSSLKPKVSDAPNSACGESSSDWLAAFDDVRGLSTSGTRVTT
eukprot:CAMPEP_0168451934 /NCGR_PEP_ID=MMETSP0228-20121227/48889_1 /TAXON_ID=133427 /ORGANISM="Protoceratium reticulatum, Strain CCCM 535 (=CCMP 1889)" /LENGTH=249 /DNA_ID=CAMNT_0008466561 /DNA_START=6 /DNA_END=755 /DNA_ORIENTATION=-